MISDRGFDGLVILLDIKGRSYEQIEDGQRILADIKAGEVWDDFVLESVEKGLVGVECLSGIPGKVGGSVVQNIGAYGREISEVIEKVRFYDIETHKFCEYSNTECRFDYRTSVFKGNSCKIATSVVFKLLADGVPSLKYKELADKFSGVKPTVAQVREAVLALRKSKSMLVDPADPNSVSAGSFFKNPVVDLESFSAIQSKYPEVPNWSQSGGMFKLSAGWLIEHAGLPRGYIYKDGKVGLSQKHALAIINRGGASADDVYGFAQFIKQRVFTAFGVKLEPEVVFVGF